MQLDLFTVPEPEKHKTNVGNAKALAKAFRFWPPMCPWSSLLAKRWIIDLVALEDKLRLKYPEFSEEESIADFVTTRFSPYHKKLLEKLL